MRFTFKHLTGSRAGQEQALEGRVINIGRNPSNLLAFDPEKDDRVSGNHAQILVLDDGKVVLSDLGSRNGTLVGGQKIMGQLPLGSGTTVQFGSEGGPEVQITYGAAPAAPAAAPAAKKGGNGCKIFLACFFLLLLLGCVIAGVVAALRSSGPGATTTETAIPPDGSTEAPATESAPATEKPAEPEKPKVTDERTAWGKLGVGSRFEQKAVSETKAGDMTMKSEMVMVYVVKSNDGKDVVVSVETTSSMDIPGVGPQKNTSTNDMTMPAKVAKVETTTEKPPEQEKRQEKVTVPAGTFDTTVWTTRTKDAEGAETVTESWMDLEEPLPYKTVMKGPTMSMTMELVKAEKK